MATSAGLPPVELLTPEEITHFKREGYVIKYGLLDPALLEASRQRLWASFPPRITEDNPASWVGPILPEEDVMNFFRWKPKGMDAETKKKMLDLFSCARNGLYDECLQLMQSDGWPLTIDAADDTGNQLLHVAASPPSQRHHHKVCEARKELAHNADGVT